MSTSAMPNVSLTIMKESKNNIRKANNNLAGTQYTDLQNICVAIYNNVNNTDDLAHKSIIDIKAVLNTTAQIRTINNLIHQKQAELKSTEDPDRRTQLEQDIEKFKEQGNKRIDADIKIIETHSQNLQNGASNIEFSEFKQQIKQIQGDLETQLSTITKNIEYYQDLKAKAQQDYDAISAGMSVLEQYNIFNYFSDMIPTPDELSNILGAGNPKLGAAILAIETYKKLLNVIGDGFSYAQMSQARTYLFDKITDYDNELQKLSKQQTQTNLNVSHIGDIGIIESERFIFTEQVKNLAEAYTIYIHGIKDLMKNDSNYDNILIWMEEMLTYISNLG